MRQKTNWFIVVIFICGCLPAKADLVFDDGGTHVVDYVLQNGIDVYNNFWDEPTHLQVMDGAEIYGSINISDSSTAEFFGGLVTLGIGLFGEGNGLVTFHEGFYDLLFAYHGKADIRGGSFSRNVTIGNDASATISGGEIFGSLSVGNSGVVDITGGSMKGFNIRNNAAVTIHGRDFAIDGRSIESMEIIPNGGDYLHGTLTGTLANGDLLNTRFEVYDYSTLTIIPEPSTLLLFGVGMFFIKRQRPRYHRDFATGSFSDAGL